MAKRTYSSEEVVEVSWEEGRRLVNECDYLFATDIRVLEQFTLDIDLSEGKAQRIRSLTAEERTSPIAALLKGARRVESDESCRLFRLEFHRDHLVSYAVLNESYSKFPEPPEELVGTRIRIFRRSSILDHIRRATIATDEYPGPLLHIQISCEDHVIDVVCTKPPRIWVRG